MILIEYWPVTAIVLLIAVSAFLKFRGK